MPVRNTYVAGIVHRNELEGGARCALQYSLDIAYPMQQVCFAPETLFVLLGGQGPQAGVERLRDLRAPTIQPCRA